jgi:acyl carrier protein
MSTQVADLDDLKSTIVRILSIELKTSEDRVRRAGSLKNELGLDSIAAANATFALEDEFSVDIEIDEGDVFDTVDDLVVLLRRALNGGSAVV